VAAFYFIALLIGGLFSAPLILSEMGVIPQIPTFIIFVAASSSSLAGIIMAGIIGGWEGVKKLLARFLIWRFDIRWWAALLILPILWWLVAILLNSLFGGVGIDFSNFQPLAMIIPILLIKVIQAGVGEEFGWRGFALPRLQSRYSALAASLIVGVMHGFWHWPMFFLEGLTQYSFRMEVGFIPAILLDTVMVTLWAIFYTWFFNNTRGSVLVSAIFHGVVPTWAFIFGFFGQTAGVGTTANLPIQLWYMGVVAVSVVVIIAMYGAKNLSRMAERQTV
jgi:membrane protease YdiL (CAAX protease family)